MSNYSGVLFQEFFDEMNFNVYSYKGNIMEFLHKNKKIILIVLIVLFIELSGYGILASLSRLLNAL